MWKIVIAIILTSTFFVLFFEPYIRTNTVIDSKNKVSTTDGFIEDTRDAFIMPRYPTQLSTRDESGELDPVYGNIGSFIPYSTDDNWISGFPHEPSESKSVEDAEAKLERRLQELTRT
tara:strand:- start:196 stop:549 length:354 start_codon:yes stop_codon:yes gene_type:complete